MPSSFEYFKFLNEQCLESNFAFEESKKFVWKFADNVSSLQSKLLIFSIEYYLFIFYIFLKVWGQSIITVKKSTFIRQSPLSFARLSPELSSTYTCRNLPSLKGPVSWRFSYLLCNYLAHT